MQKKSRTKPAKDRSAEISLFCFGNWKRATESNDKELPKAIGNHLTLNKQHPLNPANKITIDDRNLSFRTTIGAAVLKAGVVVEKRLPMLSAKGW